jgi:hypothetical protein
LKIKKQADKIKELENESNDYKDELKNMKGIKSYLKINFKALFFSSEAL